MARSTLLFNACLKQHIMIIKSLATVLKLVSLTINVQVAAFAANM